MSQSESLSVKDAAAQLGITAERLARWIRTGRVPGWRDPLDRRYVRLSPRGVETARALVTQAENSGQIRHAWADPESSRMG